MFMNKTINNSDLLKMVSGTYIHSYICTYIDTNICYARTVETYVEKMGSKLNGSLGVNR